MLRKRDSKRNKGLSGQDAEHLRRCRFETMEPRRVLSANPLSFGAVYVEADIGSDISGDTFELTFEGGAANTELTRLTIDGDQHTPGFGLGDVFFDTAPTGFGADNSFPFTQVTLQAADPGASVSASVVDGTSQLVLDLNGFRAGDKLLFEIDVDEVVDFDPSETDLTLINDGFDPLTSGVEFQGSGLTAEFTAPGFFDITGNGEFRNRYDDNLAGTGLNLPLDDATGHRDRTAGAIGQVQQEARPISIAGTVYLDPNANLAQEPGERGLENVELQLFKHDGNSFVATGHTTRTDANGDYEFGVSLDLKPGTYQVRETQPSGLFSVGAVPGTVAGAAVGSAAGTDTLTAIAIPLGGTHAVDYDFAEVRPASIEGRVHLSDADGNCFGPGATAISGVTMRLLDSSGAELATTQTDANGEYEFTGLRPGTYSVVEATPAGLIDGSDHVGTINGSQVGSVTSNDTLGGIVLLGGDQATEYNFCEHAASSLSGNVFHDQDENGSRGPGEAPIANVEIVLFNNQGQQVASTTTNSAGAYEFTNLRAGNYRIVERQPSGWLDAGDAAGTIDGSTVGTASNDEIRDISLGWGQQGVNYDFGEVLAVSIQGLVHLSDADGNCFGPGSASTPLDGVTMRLLDSNGSVLRSTQTNGNGEYSFDGLRPGTYSVVEVTPSGLVDGSEHVGRVAGRSVGTVASNDTLGGIVLASGEQGVDYNFCEHASSSLSGHVYHDQDRDNSRGPGEGAIANVLITLFDGQGQQVASTNTDANGFYEFADLRAGTYRVVEQHPAGWLDAGDSAGTINGSTVGTAANDEIRDVTLGWGQQGVNYDFGEILAASIEGLVHLTDSDGNCFAPGAADTAISGVTVRLLDSSGSVVRETTTNSNGEYRFGDLVPGTYSVVEVTPGGLVDGSEHVGTVNGRTVGNVGGNDTLAAIVVGSGEQAINYNFCEHESSSLSGHVYHDQDRDGVRGPGEAPIANTTITLLDDQGQTVASTTTDGNGAYEFTGLRAGTYRIVEQQPSGWLDASEAVGTIDGSPVGTVGSDLIRDITLGWGQQGVNYDFGEILAGSIAGSVHLDLDGDCDVDPGETMLGGVTIELLDGQGNVVATTQTNNQGAYAFNNLSPATYSVRQVQPGAYFNGGEDAGSGGGDVTANLVANIQVGSGDHLSGYDFCEVPPSSLSGYVFQDGEEIETEDGLPPANLQTIRDGQRTADDTPLEGVVLELRDGRTGLVLTDAHALPGTYAPGAIQVRTDANGYYQFNGLQGGRTYAVYEVHPQGYVDHVDTAGTTSGLALNGLPLQPVLGQGQLGAPIQRHADAPPTDAIVEIQLGIGQHSQNNNFSEVLVVEAPPERPTFPVPPRIPPVSPLGPVNIPPLVVNPPVFAGITPPALNVQAGGIRAVPGFTWHLSVINGGLPRDAASAGTAGTPVSSIRFVDQTAWRPEGMSNAEWIVMPSGEDDASTAHETVRRYFFGIHGGIPLTGDFNGDGIDEFVVFYNGEWFIDLNGNGRWDEGDLWAKLGGPDDLPVTGDWDGDGKDDIGVYGREWEGDSRAVKVEPGLPDAGNAHTFVMKNAPPRVTDAADGERLLQLNQEGPRRADLIDHVFRFGDSEDVPVTGDWNGDGIRTVGVFRDGVWQLDLDGDGRWTSRDASVEYGREGDWPVVGDWDGDGVDDVGIYRDGRWVLDDDGNRELDAHDRVFESGGRGKYPVVGDWDGDGVDEPGLYREVTRRPDTDVGG